MRPALLLLCSAALLAGLPTQARSPRPRIAELQHSPAQAMLNSLDSMTNRLNQVSSRQEAETAAPELLQLHQEYLVRRDAAEDMPEMPSGALDRHLARLDRSMNHFRLACARLLREKCYGSAQLRNAIQTVARDF